MGILKEQDVIEAVKKAVDTCGGIDILANNSGIGGPARNVWDLKLEDWNEIIGADLCGSMLCSREVLMYMVPAAKGGNKTGGRPSSRRRSTSARYCLWNPPIP